MSGDEISDKGDSQDVSGSHESAFTRDIAKERERIARPSDIQSDKPEIPLRNLDANQQEKLKTAVNQLATQFAKVDDGLASAQKQGAALPEESRSKFDQWYSGYQAKVLADLRRSVDDVGQTVPFRASVPIQIYGAPGEFQPQTVSVSVPPKPDDVFIAGTHAGIRAHSQQKERETEMRNQPGDQMATGASMHEVVFRLKRAGIYS